jgi:Ca-activated chloride channel homolog
MRVALVLSLFLILGSDRAVADAKSVPQREAAPAKAGLALVFAVDASASIGSDTYVLERDGIARAFLDPQVVKAVSALAGGIEALVFEWSDPSSIVTSVPWTLVRDQKSAHAFAAALRATRRSSHGLTAIGSAILAAIAAFGRMPEPAARRVIDISGDGISNLGISPAVARERAVAAGITINGLAILDEEPWLADYYRREVIGGASAFVMTARGYDSFARAMLHKLQAEIAGRAIPARTAQRQ